MKYFKDKNTGEVYAYDKEQIDGGWVKEGLVAMTKEEVSAHLVPKPPTAEQVRAKRDRFIESVRWRIERHRDELEFGRETTEPLEPLLQYVQALRDVPQQEGFPTDIVWPEVSAGVRVIKNQLIRDEGNVPHAYQDSQRKSKIKN